MKRMACIIDDETVIERRLCPACGKVYYQKEDYWFYFDLDPGVPWVPGNRKVEDIYEIICDDCTTAAEFFFGKNFILSLFREDDSDIVEFLARTAKRIKKEVFCVGVRELFGFYQGCGYDRHPIRSHIENQVFRDGSTIKFLGGSWVLVQSEHRKKYGIRPVELGRV